MENCVFPIGEKPYCMWDVDIKARNMEFLEGIDEDYFTYVALGHYEHIDEGDERDKARAALALRHQYHVGLETLFAFLCASVQAPNCPAGWIQMYETSTLLDVTQKLTKSHGYIYSNFKKKPQSWLSLAEKMFTYAIFSTEKDYDICEEFAGLWSRFAGEFLNPSLRKEYASIKHGFRARSGGFTLAVGIEPEYGVPPPPEEMKVVGSSPFGSSFEAAEQIEGSPDKKAKDPHFRLRKHATNWHPLNCVHGLQFISMSLGNVKSFLQILNGKNANEVMFHRPQNKSEFMLPWREQCGVNHSTLDVIITEKDIARKDPRYLKKLMSST